MNDLERVHVKLGVSGTYWDKKPQYRVMCNDKVLHEGTITAESDVVEYVEFDCEDGEEQVEFKVSLLNKDSTDVVKDNDDPVNFKIVKDMLLNIVSLEVDEIALGNLIYEKTEFVPEDPDRPVLKICVNLGWNGTWTLRWTNPFYIWLLENI